MQGGRQGAALFGALIFWLILPAGRARIKQERHMCLSICAVPAQMIRDYRKRRGGLWAISLPRRDLPPESRRRRGERKAALGKPRETVGLQSYGTKVTEILSDATLAGLRF